MNESSATIDLDRLRARLRALEEEAGRIRQALAGAGARGRDEVVETAQRTGNGRLGAIFEQATVGLSEIDLDGRFIRVNDFLCRLLGRPREAVLRLSIQDVTHPDDLPRNLPLFAHMVETGEPFVIEKRYVRPDGTHLWCSSSVTRIDHSDGGPPTVLAVTVDLTERKRSENARRETEERFRKVFEHSSDAIFVLDPERNAVLEVNPAGVAMFGYDTREELLATPLAEFHPEDLPRFLEFIRGVHDQGTGWTDEFACRTKVGQFLTSEISASTLVVEGRTCILAIVRDIGERKRAEAALRRSEAIKTRIIESSADCIKLLDPDGRLLWMSQSGQHALEIRDIDALIGTSWIGFWNGEYRQAAEEAIKAAVAGGVGRFTGWCPTQTGRDKWWDSIVTPIMDADGRLDHLLAVSRDMTEGKHIEEALREETRTLETLNRMGKVLAAELDLGRLVQAATDAATEVSGAEFGAFFYNVIDERGEAYMLYTLSGASREDFARFPMPRNTKVFAPTFQGQGVIRVDDITKDPRYGRNPPYNGMPEGHLPVRSYLAAPVVSRSGEVLGGLFFGHGTPGVFTARAERIVAGIAAQTAIAIDNARLYEAAQREIAERRRAEGELKTITDNASVGILLMDDRQHCVFMNPAAERITGYTLDETRGRPLHEVMHHTHPDGSPYPLEECPIDRAFPERNQMRGEEVFVHKDGRFYPVAFTASPVRNEAAQVIGTVVEIQDITERKRAEEHRELLLAELNHRVKNTLATVQSIANQMLKGTNSVETYRDALTARVIALSHAHNLLSQSNWQGAALRDVILAELRPHLGPDSGRLALEGGSVHLPPRAALSLGMAFHELATNAAKYGALSVPSGRLVIAWGVETASGRPRLHLNWTESGGPRVEPPARRGFGSVLIERGLAHELDGEVSLIFDPAGVRCSLEIPLGP